MNKVIKNKKGFWSGVFFLLLAVIDIPLFIIHYNGMDTMRIIKSIVITNFCLLFGVTEVYRSINSKCAKKDEQNNDERERLVSLKSKSSALKITFICGIILAILLAIGIGVTKSKELVGIFVGIVIVLYIMFISEIGTYFYHNKRN